MPPNRINYRRPVAPPQRRIFDDFSSAYFQPLKPQIKKIEPFNQVLPVQEIDVPIRAAATPESIKVTSKPRRLGLPKFHSWQEFRIFSAGAFFALGLLTVGFYFGVTRPSIHAERTSTSDESQSVTLEDGTVVEVDEGVNTEDVDHRPAPPITGSMPKNLSIPQIGVNSPIRSLGLTKNGALAVPNYLWQIGWYNASSRPGEPGTVVLDGHFNGRDYAALRKLHTLEKGADITIERGDGEVITYVVESKEIFPKDSVPMDRLIGGDGAERLHIITCEGTWIDKEQTFNNRLVVFAKRKT